jgi:arginyl-tRNA synthetase
MKIKDELVKIVKKQVSSEFELEIPPEGMGDFALPCFGFSKELKKNPGEIAKDLSLKIKANFIEKIEVKGAYLNFFIKQEYLASSVVEEIIKKKGIYGKGNGKENIVIEFPSPNTNKPLHLGHVRNILIGESVSRILEFNGNKVYRVNLNNDRGIHICKSMLAYKKFGDNKKPDKKSDHFVGDYYVKFSEEAGKDKNLEEEAQRMLKKWEDGDDEIVSLWRKMNKWALKGFDETYKKFGLKFDKTYNESEHYKEGKDIVMDGLKKGIFHKTKNGAIAVDLKEHGLDEKILLRPDGTSIYITQDINLAKLKYKDFKFDRSIIVTGSEQNYHFKALFKVLGLLGVPYAKGNYHLSYGMVYLPEGKMKSREGNVVDADDLIDGMINMAREEVVKRYKNLEHGEIEDRSAKIGKAALKFFILKTDSSRDINFNPEESISFEGETGPYCQYVYARISSILRKYGKKAKIVKIKLEEDDRELAKFLGQFSEVIENVCRNYKPHVLARYLLELSQRFNNYYGKVSILKSEGSLLESRIMLITAVKQVLENGLRLLGIDVVEEM